MSLVFGNFKMNTTTSEFKSYLQTFLPLVKDCKNKICLCLPYTHLYCADLFKNCAIEFGAQNISEHIKGAYTGEISASMIKDLNVGYVILGHSERRQYFSEEDIVINKKIKSALENNLKVVLCIGENKSQYDNNETIKVLQNQITTTLGGISQNDIQNIILAYEPLWSIGTGIIPRLDEIEQTTKFIKKVVAEKFSCECNVLYGGSVNEQNSKSILKVDGLDGVLVGGASLKPINFSNICNNN